jgi:two-component sensor histidine kinase/CheY-like chemotaxis protein
MAPLRTLIVEDRAADVELMLHELRQAGFAPDWQRAQTGPEYRACLDPHLDVILADYNLPQFDALRALHLLQESGLDIPFIVITASLNEEVAVTCMKEGATDYLLKDRLARLGQAVTQALQQKRLRDAKRRAEERIRASLREKEVLLQEIHHRVKNNLQVVSSLLGLQSKRTKDAEVREMLRNTQNRIKSMALIHEKLYQAESMARIDFADYLRSLLSHLHVSHAVNGQDVLLKADVEDVPVSIDIAVPCGLMINELVTNALKHAFPEGRRGEISVGLQAEAGQQLVLTVTDNGVGFPKDFDIRDPASLGLQLVNGMTHQLGGTLELVGGHGTTFRISFQESNYKERGYCYVEPANSAS